MGVDVNGDPDRYQRGIYDSIQREWVSIDINLGGIAEVISFCPLIGAKAFFVLKCTKEHFLFI